MPRVDERTPMLNKCLRNRNNGDEDVVTEEVRPRLNCRNYANLLGYIINVAVTYLGNAAQVFGGEDIGTVSDRYQTIISPAGTAFSIWSIIFLFQAIFAVVQMLPWYRANPLVQSGVAYWYLSACLFQAVWTIVWGYQIIWASLIIMMGIWISLVGLVISQYMVTTAMLEGGVSSSSKESGDGARRCCCGGTKGEMLCNFWILKFPFEIHFGWITCAATLNFNIMFVASGGFTAPRLLASGIVSLAVLHAIALFVLFVPRRPNYTVPLVISWANAWIAVELSNPKDSIKETFSEDIITAARYAASAVAVIVVILVAIRLAIALMCKYVPFFQKDEREGTTTIEAETGEAVTSTPV